MVFSPLKVSLVFLALATCAVVAGAASAAEPGTYVGAGRDRPCVEFKVGGKAPYTLTAVRVGGCDWLFVCGSNGSRGAPALYAGPVGLNEAGSFEIHKTESGEGFGEDLYWDVTGTVGGRRASGTFRFHYGPICDTGVIQWNAEREFGADAGGPYEAHRGESLKLDGSGSKLRKRITSYRWRFSKADCPRVKLGGGSGTARRVRLRADAKKQGARTSIKPLCSITATLTVSDGTSTDTDSARISVTERPWKKLRVTHAARPVPFKADLFGFDSCLECVFGNNVCKDDRDDAWIHPGPPNEAIKRGGVTLARVDDPHGPFDGMAYVRARKLKISRVALVNGLLFPGSELYRINAKLGRADDVKALRESVVDHERFHSELAQRALADHDPTSALEGLVTDDIGVLKEYVAARLSATDQELWKASNDGAVKELMRAKWGKRSAKIKLPPYGRKYFVTGPLSELGDERH